MKCWVVGEYVDVNLFGHLFLVSPTTATPIRISVVLVPPPPLHKLETLEIFTAFKIYWYNYFIIKSYELIISNLRVKGSRIHPFVLLDGRSRISINLYCILFRVYYRVPFILYILTSYTIV